MLFLSEAGRVTARGITHKSGRDAMAADIKVSFPAPDGPTTKNNVPRGVTMAP